MPTAARSSLAHANVPPLPPLELVEQTKLRSSRQHLLHLLAEGAALGQPGLAARGLAEHGTARPAKHDRLRVAEHRRDVKAAGALDVHEEGVGRLDEPLELVAALLQLPRWVQQVNVSHRDERHGSRGGLRGGELEAEGSP